MSDRPRLHYEITGHGPHVVLLHPVGLDLTFLDPLADAMRQKFTILSVDLRGHGRSPLTPPAGSLQDFVEDVHALLVQLAYAPAALVGFSFGGMLAQVLTLSHPGDVSALVVCASRSTLTPEARQISAARGSDAERAGMAAVLEATMDRWFTPQFRASGSADAAAKRLLANDATGWAQAWRAISTIDTAARLDEIRVPTLCVAGELDKSSPPEIVKAIADKIPGARYAVVPGAPHMLFVEQPQEIARLVTGFLSEVTRPA